MNVTEDQKDWLADDRDIVLSGLFSHGEVSRVREALSDQLTDVGIIVYEHWA